ncbi:hypothetical protein [Polyangium sp. 15x6]|uniref:hypothetical protein n=1 Tax=Polyangium sp. 15x6 TaxID=3042687 RepID=UPI00249A1ECB|nr:hypothetical protein [Polyangium sp. 15x6]MDI3290740.1 hypothetical protein [Polyangium sp. 15x6]
MSDGINKLFLSDPVLFLRTHPLISVPAPSLAMQKGICEVNLIIKSKHNNMPAVTLEKVPAGAKKSFSSHAFKAHYLAWQQDAEPVLQLGAGADYFFTAGLTGCRLVITPGPIPTVRHIDGGKFTNQQMDARCNVRSAGNFNITRYWDNGNHWLSHVIGVRKRTGWHFYAQDTNYNSVPPFMVTQV